MVGGATSGPIMRAAFNIVVPSGTSIGIPSMVTLAIIYFLATDFTDYSDPFVAVFHLFFFENVLNLYIPTSHRFKFIALTLNVIKCFGYDGIIGGDFFATYQTSEL